MLWQKTSPTKSVWWQKGENMVIPNTVLLSLRETFSEGTRVRLLKMDDTQAPPIGTEGTVVYVDDIGTVHISWDNGSGLGAVWEEDRIEKV